MLHITGELKATSARRDLIGSWHGRTAREGSESGMTGGVSSIGRRLVYVTDYYNGYG